VGALGRFSPLFERDFFGKPVPVPQQLRDRLFRIVINSPDKPGGRRGCQAGYKAFSSEVAPVRVKKTRENKKLEPVPLQSGQGALVGNRL
jgi:hypothetical protein